MKQYQLVQVIAIRSDRFKDQAPAYKRNPIVGDIGTILEMYQKPVSAYEIECTDPNDGSTTWLEAMFHDELSSVESITIDIEIHGWRVGFEKITNTNLLQKFAGMGLKQAHESTHAILDGHVVTFHVPDIQTARLAHNEFSSIGAIAQIVLKP